jgi:hypothetical protein
VQLISAFGWLETRHLHDHGLGGLFRETMLGRTRAEVSAAAAAAAQEAPGLEISERVVDGSPVPLLVAASRQGVGRPRGSWPRRLHGPADRFGRVGLTARAERPVVVVRGERSSDASPLMVGIDGSQVSKAALAFAFEAAVEREVPLIAVHAVIDSGLEAGHRLLAERLAG